MICSMRYMLQTRSMETDMNTMKQKGTIRVKIIEPSAYDPISDRVSYSS